MEGNNVCTTYSLGGEDAQLWSSTPCDSNFELNTKKRNLEFLNSNESEISNRCLVYEPNNDLVHLNESTISIADSSLHKNKRKRNKGYVNENVNLENKTCNDNQASNLRTRKESDRDGSTLVDVKDLLDDLYEPTEEDLKKLDNLHIEIHWPLPLIHELDSGSAKMTLEKLKELLGEQKNTLDISKFSKNEEQRIVKNWQQFGKKYNFNEPRLFTPKVELFGHFKYKERLKFKQWLAYKLPYRRLSTVYRKFSDIYSVVTRGRWTKSEDQQLIDIFNSYKRNKRGSKAPVTFTLYKLMMNALGRNYMSIHRRLLYLMNNTHHLESNDTSHLTDAVDHSFTASSSSVPDVSGGNKSIPKVGICLPETFSQVPNNRDGTNSKSSVGFRSISSNSKGTNNARRLKSTVACRLSETCSQVPNTSDGIEWTPGLEGKLVHSILTSLNKKDLEELRYCEVPNQIWSDVASDLHIKQEKVINHWRYVMYPQLFARRSISQSQLQRNLICRLYGFEVKEWCEINWKKLSKKFYDLGHYFLYFTLQTMIEKYVPKRKQADLGACIAHLFKKIMLTETEVDDLFKRTQYNPITRLVEEIKNNDMIEISIDKSHV